MSKKILAGVGVAAALGVAIVPSMGTFAATTTTYIKATVEEFVGCTSTNDTAATALDLGNIAAGTAKSGSFSIEGSTNDPAGFTITGTPRNLVHANGTDAIAYSASAVDSAETASGWYATAATGSETGATIGATIALNSATTGIANARLNSWTINATVKTATTSTVGTYSGQIDWTCLVNH